MAAGVLKVSKKHSPGRKPSAVLEDALYSFDFSVAVFFVVSSLRGLIDQAGLRLILVEPLPKSLLLLIPG